MSEGLCASATPLVFFCSRNPRPVRTLFSCPYVTSLGIILLATRTPARRRSPVDTVETSNWHSRAVDAYAKGAAFDGAVRAAERLDPSTEAAGIHWADLRRRADDLTEVLYAMRETAPTEHRRDQVENAILSLRAVRDAFEAQRPPGGDDAGGKAR